MKNFVFKIFGAPHTFDLYQGNGNEIEYFQTFDNGSKENTKLVIHRMVSDNVSYSYLRYNFISGGGRENSWFGMSVIFNGEYCNNIEGIYELFDTVYKEIILKNKRLITEIKGNPKIQAKYLVRSFAEAEEEVRIVERNIIDNLEKYFVENILPLDASFLQNNTGLINLNVKKGNNVFVNALRKYSWLSISSEYKETEEVLLSPEEIAKIDKIITDESLKISQISVNILSKRVNSQAVAYIGESDNKIKEAIKTIKSSVEKQPELQERAKKLDNLQDQLHELKNVLNGNFKDPLPPEPYPPGHPEPYPPIDDYASPPLSKDRIMFIVGGLIVILILFLSVLFILLQPNKPIDDKQDLTGITAEATKDNTQTLIDEGNAFLTEEKFDEAINKFKEAGRENLVSETKKKAVSYLLDKAKKEEIKNPQEAINILQETRTYDYNPDSYIKIIKEQISKQKQKSGSVEDTQKSTNNNQQGTVQIRKNGQSITGFEYEVGDRLELSAYQNTSLLSDGTWSYENNNIDVDNRSSNPVTVLMKKEGSCSLYYKVNGKEKASINITIKKREANI